MTWWGIPSILESDREARLQSRLLLRGQSPLFRFVRKVEVKKKSKVKAEKALVFGVLTFKFTHKNLNSWMHTFPHDWNWWPYLDDGCWSRWPHFTRRFSHIQQRRPQNEQILWCSKNNSFVIFIMGILNLNTFLQNISPLHKMHRLIITLMVPKIIITMHMVWHSS